MSVIRGKAEFVFYKSHGDFVLKSYSEEIADRLNPEQKNNISFA